MVVRMNEWMNELMEWMNAEIMNGRINGIQWWMKY